MRSVRAWLFCLLVCFTSIEAAHAMIVLVSSENGGAYSQASDAIIKELERSGRPRSDIRVLLASELQELPVIETSATRLVITLGAEALRLTLARPVNAPILASLVPRNVQERLLRLAPRKPAHAVSVLYLDQPLARQVDLLRLAFPEARKIGVVASPELASAVSNLQSLAAARKLQVIHESVSDSAGIYPALRSVLDGADVILALADPKVYNSASISNVLLSTYRARIPMQAFSPSYVKAGATLALFSTPEQVGLQTGEMARSLLVGAPPGITAYPSVFEVDVNEHVARSLGYSLSGPALKDQLLRLERKP